MSGLNLNFNEVESNRQVAEGSTPQVQRLTPGIHENVTVTGVTEGTTLNGKGIIKVSFLGTGGEIFEPELSTEGGAIPYTLKKLKHLMTKVVTEDVANGAKTVAEVNKILTGSKFRLKVCGEEYVNAKGETKVKSTLGLPNFAESADLEKGFSRLRYDSNNQYDMKRLNKATLDANTTASAVSDMPF